MALNLKMYLYNVNKSDMKLFKQISLFIGMLLLIAGFSQCSTAQKLEKTAPFDIKQVYAQKWAAGVQGGGSGINVYIPVEYNSISLDSMFFRGQKVRLEFIRGEQGLYVGRFLTDSNRNPDIILSSDMKEESKNKLPKFKTDIPFDIDDDECIVTYRKGDKTRYFKISNIKMEQPLHYPSAPPKGQ